MSFANEIKEPCAKRSNVDSGMKTIHRYNDNGENAGMLADDENRSTNDDLQAKIVAVWSANEADVALATTVAILNTQIDKLIKEGITAFHHAESSQSALTQLQLDMAHKDAEIARLRAGEEKNTKALSVCICSPVVLVVGSTTEPPTPTIPFLPKKNVLRALEQSRSTAREYSTHAVTEAHLRAELSMAIRQRDEATGTAAESQRKTALLLEEARDLKLKLSRVTQDKLKLERDSVGNGIHYFRIH